MREGPPLYFEKTYDIDSRDLDCFNVCRASALLGYLQDAGGLAAAVFGATNGEMVVKHRHCWMVARTGFTLDRPLVWGDSLTVKTWHRGGDKPLMLRDYDLLSHGQPVGQALTVWVLVDLDSHTISRPNRFPEFADTDGGPLIRDTKLPRHRPPANLTEVEVRALHYSDTDGNGHVNNTRYADLLCDAVGLQQAPAGSFVRELYLSYTRECKAGEALALRAGREDRRQWAVGLDSQGQERFHGYVVI